MDFISKYKDLSDEVEYVLQLLSEQPERLDELRTKQYDINNISQSHRVINSWESIGILDDTRKNNKGWRKFSLSDIVWITIITKLREFGLSIEKIKKTKESLLSPVTVTDRNTKTGLTALDWLCLRILLLTDRGNTYLLVEEDGTATVMMPRNFNINHTLGNIPDSYIYINVNKLLGTVITGITVWDDKQFVLSDEDIELISALKNSIPKRPTIVRSELDKNGKITFIEQEYNVKPQEFGGIHETINKFKYGKIKEANFRDGKMDHLIISRLKKIKK